KNVRRPTAAAAPRRPSGSTSTRCRKARTASNWFDTGDSSRECCCPEERSLDTASGNAVGQSWHVVAPRLSAREHRSPRAASCAGHILQQFQRSQGRERAACSPKVSLMSAAPAERLALFPHGKAQPWQQRLMPAHSGAGTTGRQSLRFSIL